MRTDQPSEAGAVHASATWVLPRVGVREVGAPGTAAGVTLFDALEEELVPTALVAVTVKV